LYPFLIFFPISCPRLISRQDLFYLPDLHFWKKTFLFV
jgi:hypothetical protein